MDYAFRRHAGLILIEAQLSGPKGATDANLLLDTGASATVLNSRMLRLVGYAPGSSRDVVSLTAGIGSASAPRLMINRLSALGHHAIGLRILAHDLPSEAGVDGLLGLDFFRDLTLTIDFRAGQITLV